MLWPTFIFWGLTILSFICGLAYLTIQLKIRNTWHSIPTDPLDKSFVPRRKYSVIIAARNEAENIVPCIKSILNSNFPAEQFEVMVVDDHSEDETIQSLEAIQDSRLRVLSLQSGEGKKAAIQQGIQSSEGDWIVTTDADCIWDDQSLQLIAQKAEGENFKCITGPVLVGQAENFIERFQEMDFMGTMVVTGSGIHRKTTYLANGAFLAYPKKMFIDLGGFKGDKNYASGDDILFLQKIARDYPGSISFIKNPDHVVRTKAEPNFKSFFQQRLRWASKTNAFPNKSTWWVMVLVFLNSFFLVMTFLMGVGGFGKMILVFLFLLINKWVADGLVLQSASRFYSKPLRTFQFLGGSIFHAFYITLIGIRVQFPVSYNWKGRVTR
ncbi:MAG: glycosyltransferase [Saprospiraceae bacterium]|nr:glycosyltransferase [Saprospiraceae bacterium]